MTVFSGFSGYNYEFAEYPISSNFNDGHCVYIYAKLFFGFYTPLYIGQTIHLQTRMNEHLDDGVYNCAYRHGVTHLLVHVPYAQTIADAKTACESVERDLLMALNTPCNTQLNS